MARWEPDAQGRLQLAALTLFGDRGYADVTVAEIADHAGLTKRTFFNHFPDKREVLFAGATAYQRSIVDHLARAGADLSPIDAALLALSRGGLELARYADYARLRRELIASSSELQERDLNKNASLVAAIANGLRQRNVLPRPATLTAQAAVTVFNAAYADWVDEPTADLAALVQQALLDLRAAVGAVD